MKKVIKNNLKSFIVGIIIFGAISVFATANTITSSSVEYKESKSVETALNELYQKERQLPKKYMVGDTVTVKNAQYIVLANSPRTQDYVTLIKAEPLTVEEVNANKIGLDGVNHVNRYTHSDVGEAAETYGQAGGLAYYSSSNCGFQTPGGNGTDTGCKDENATNYDTSDIKYVVDKWASTNFQNNELKEVNNYKARLVEKEELRTQFYPSCSESDTDCAKESTTPSWFDDYAYWTMTKSSDLDDNGRAVWVVYGGNMDSTISFGGVYHNINSLCPVINVYKNKI